jgi:hypothetical protein
MTTHDTTTDTTQRGYALTYPSSAGSYHFCHVRQRLQAASDPSAAHRRWRSHPECEMAAGRADDRRRRSRAAESLPDRLPLVIGVTGHRDLRE